MKRNSKLIVGVVALALVAGVSTSIAVYAQNEKKPDKLVINPSNANYAVTKGPLTTVVEETGATKWFDTEVLPYIGERKAETKALLDHSYKLIDAYLIGSVEVAGMGDFIIDPFTTEEKLTADYNKFKSLYVDELKRGAAVNEELKTYTDGPLPWNKHKDRALLQIVMKIDEAYRGAIDNLNWSNTEKPDASDAPLSPGINEEKEFNNIRERAADTRFMKARDVFQRYHTWLFGGKFNVEGVQKDNRPDANP